MPRFLSSSIGLPTEATRRGSEATKELRFHRQSIPLTLSAFLEATLIEDNADEALSWPDMVGMAYQDFLELANVIELQGDITGVSDNLSQELQTYLAQQAWFMRSHLE